MDGPNTKMANGLRQSRYHCWLASRIIFGDTINYRLGPIEIGIGHTQHTRRFRSSTWATG